MCEYFDAFVRDRARTIIARLEEKIKSLTDEKKRMDDEIKSWADEKKRMADEITMLRNKLKEAGLY